MYLVNLLYPAVDLLKRRTAPFVSFWTKSGMECGEKISFSLAGLLSPLTLERMQYAIPFSRKTHHGSYHQVVAFRCLSYGLEMNQKRSLVKSRLCYFTAQ